MVPREGGIVAAASMVENHFSWWIHFLWSPSDHRSSLRDECAH